MNNPHVSVITEPLGLGAPIIFMSIVALCLVISFRMDLLIIPSYTVGISGIFLVLALACTVLSGLGSLDILRTSKAVISLAFVIFLGWFIFGKIYYVNQDKSRRIIILVSDVVGFFSVLNVALVIVFAGPYVLRGEVGGYESTISFLGMSVPRLQAEGFNATGVGIASGIAILWLYSVYQRNVYKPINKVLTLVLIAISFLGLIWSASRGAIITFFSTCILLGMLRQLNYKNLTLYVIVVTFLTGVLLYLFINELPGIMYRGLDVDTGISLIELFYSSRLKIIESSVYMLLEPTLFGHGFGILSAGPSTNGHINIESFFFRIWVELGFVGSFVYIITFVLLTVYVIRADRYFFLRGEIGAFFPSSILLFTWINSPTSFGFSLPVGLLAIELAIATGSLFIWRKVKRPLACKIAPTSCGKMP